jgi:hypothetical protein
LIMTFMFDPAKLQMNWAKASGTSIFRSDEAGTSRAAPLVMSMRLSLLPGEPARWWSRSWDSQTNTITRILTGRITRRE